jgi:glutaminyl-peptide cyclotransferase
MKEPFFKTGYILIGIFFILILWLIPQIINTPDPLFDQKSPTNAFSIFETQSSFGTRYSRSSDHQINDQFDPTIAMLYIEAQLSFGPRYPGSSGHLKVINWIKDQLTQLGWQIEEQSFFYNQKKITNILAKSTNIGNLIIIGTHYDTRQYADRDSIIDNRNLPVPGANDGASGVAVLLELARVLLNDDKNTYWFIFFDAEDQGEIQGWEWIIGSTYFAQSLTIKPETVLILDMIGDQNLNIYKEGYSDQKLQAEIWKIASNMGYTKYFIPEIKYQMIDDQKPFSDMGISSALFIDFDYPYWHTLEDTIDKISPVSLQILGSTILEWIKSK